MTSLDEKRLSLLHPLLQNMAREHFRISSQKGVPFRIAQGFRSSAEQAALYAKGRNGSGQIVRPGEVVTMAPPGRSWHEYGLAYDIVLITPQGTVTWDEAYDGDLDGIRDWQEAGVAGEQAGLEWGGRWRKIRDLPHFQLTRGLTYEVAAAITANGTKPIPPDYFS